MIVSPVSSSCGDSPRHVTFNESVRVKFIDDRDNPGLQPTEQAARIKHMILQSLPACKPYKPDLRFMRVTSPPNNVMLTRTLKCAEYSCYAASAASIGLFWAFGAITIIGIIGGILVGGCFRIAAKQPPAGFRDWDARGDRLIARNARLRHPAIDLRDYHFDQLPVRLHANPHLRFVIVSRSLPDGLLRVRRLTFINV